MNVISPPHDLAAEQAVLGSILLSDVPMKALIIDLGLSADAFYRDQHGRVWDAMVAVTMSGARVDELTLRAQLAKDGAKGLDVLVAELPGMAPAAGNVLRYAKQVIESAEWRNVLRASYKLAEAAAGADSDARREAEGMLNAVRRGSSDTRSPRALAEDVLKHLEGNTVPAWKTPWPAMNDAMGGGLRAGETTLLGGWTSHGKSIVADQLLRFCRDQGAKVHLYINEMAPTMRALRTVSSMTSVPQRRLAQPKEMKPEDMSRVMQMLSDANGEMPFGITRVTDWTAEEVARDIRFRGWDVCALDMLHKLPFENERELARISTQLTAAALTANTHLVATVHLNEARATAAILPSPVLRDIRYSGMLKNDADNVMFVHRKEEEDMDGNPERTNEASIYLHKCRNGRLHGVRAHFDDAKLRFLETTRYE